MGRASAQHLGGCQTKGRRRRWRAAGRKGDPAAKMYSSGGGGRRAAPSRGGGRSRRPGPALPPLRGAASWRWSKRPCSRRYSPPPRSQKGSGRLPPFLKPKWLETKWLEPMCYTIDGPATSTTPAGEAPHFVGR